MNTEETFKTTNQFNPRDQDETTSTTDLPVQKLKKLKKKTFWRRNTPEDCKSEHHSHTLQEALGQNAKI